MKPAEFIRVRNCLELSQRQLSRLLATSLRSVQAYEQGWRVIPAVVPKNWTV